MDTVYIDHFLTNPNGEIEVGYHLNAEPAGAHARLYSSYTEMLAEGSALVAEADTALKIAMASWLGIDPTGSDQSLATEFRTEIDMSALVSIRRVLDI